MSDTENDRRRVNGDDDNDADVSPGAAFLPFIEMEALSNKLKLLDYEAEYLLKWRMKPLSK